ncbi:hypothetical protein P4679_23105 [Priestia megaterium]|uniref:hypothetical protein n=1 Tax=Priestia megaterium TaxID=1404 RepID=UPI002E208DCE|nr:hypothetical protein [Priestia megaterium]
MRKGLFYLLALAVLCIGGLTGCSLFNEKEENTDKQTSVEEKAEQKETEAEENSKNSNDGEEKNEVTKEVEKSEVSKGSSSSEENTSSTSKDSSKKAETVSSQVDWGSAWTRDIQFDHALLEITQKSGNTFTFKIHATNALDAAAVKRGAVNVGEVYGTAKVEGDVATQTAPDPDTGCQVKMTNYTGYIQVEPVTDCSGAAGMRVHFDGKYKKGNIPEPEIAVEDDANDNFEPSEDEAQNNNDEATEEDSQNSVESDSTDQSLDSSENNTSENSVQPISRDEARQLVVNYLHPDDPESIIEYDHDDNGDYIFHYYKVIDDGTDTAHTATTGWYGINPYTKEIYDYMAVNN